MTRPSPTIPYTLPYGLDSCTPARVQTAKIGSMVDVNNSDDPEGLQTFYYLVQDLKVRHCGGLPSTSEGAAMRPNSTDPSRN